jgi:hypothetical protein
MQDSGNAVNYDRYESELLGLIDALRGDLMDIEMAIQQALESARNGFINTVKAINDDMVAFQTDLFAQISNELQVFGQKLKEDLNKEREQFQQMYDQDE